MEVESWSHFKGIFPASLSERLKNTSTRYERGKNPQQPQFFHKYCSKTVSKQFLSSFGIEPEFRFVTALKRWRENAIAARSKEKKIEVKKSFYSEKKWIKSLKKNWWIRLIKLKSYLFDYQFNPFLFIRPLHVCFKTWSCCSPFVSIHYQM